MSFDDEGRTVSEIVLSSGLVLSTGDYYVQLGDDVIDLPSPSAGVGGSELVVSPDERLVAMFVYSGQSQVGYELFRIDAVRGALEHIGGLPYVRGEGTAPVWSPDSRWLAMLASVEPIERGTGQYVEELLDPDAGADADEIVAERAQLFLQAIPEAGPPGPIERHLVGATIRRNADFDAVASWDVFTALAFSSAGTLVLAPRWAPRLEVGVPVVGEITLVPYGGAYEGLD